MTRKPRSFAAELVTALIGVQHIYNGGRWYIDRNGAMLAAHRVYRRLRRSRNQKRGKERKGRK